MVIGSSHVSRQSVKLIRNAIKNFDPDIVMIELDEERLNSIRRKEKTNFFKWFKNSYKQLGITTSIFLYLLKRFQDTIGKKLGIIPGKDMLTAYYTAKRNKKKVLLIDQPFSITSIKLSRVIGIKGLLLMIIQSIFISNKPKSMGSLFNDPTEEEVEEAKRLLKKLNKGLYKVLLEERNRYMANKAYQYYERNKEKALIVVGAAHARDVFELIRKEIEKNKKE